MIFYEKDELNIPQIYKKMTQKQLRRVGKVLEVYAIVVAKIFSLFIKKKKNTSNIKFYID